ncbi:MAG: THUMP domain-containing class I SAM-dependent RNA methyltransferase [Betaproteobacteria bacterium]
MAVDYFAPCPRGLEGVLAEELKRIGAGRVSAVEGGVDFSGEMALCYAANLESRIASRVLWRVGHAPYRSDKDIYAAARELPWTRWFDVERSIRVNLSAIRSPLKSLDFATLRIKDAVCDGFREACGRRPDVDTAHPDVRVHAFLTRSHVSFYLDTSGEPLFKRGWRTAAGEAPLRENLAAGIVRLSDWRPGTPLLDPMCGGGTLLVEAAMIALEIAPGLGRAFGFEKLAIFDSKAWQVVRKRAADRPRPPHALGIYGSDKFGAVLDLARRNLEAAGLEKAVALKQVDVLESSPPASGGVMVMNPPYGERLGNRESLASFYPQLGNTLKKRYANWNAYVLSADMRLPTLIGLKATRRTPLYNGALECRLLEFKLVAGSMRRKPA